MKASRLFLGVCVCWLGACDGELSEGANDGGGSDARTGPCTPTTCAAEGKNCGIMPDGCGGELNCGGCEAPEFCGGGGSANLCGANTCTPITCADVIRCGVVSDGCAGTLSCGACGDASVDASSPDGSEADAQTDARVPDANVADATFDAVVPDAEANVPDASL